MKIMDKYMNKNQHKYSFIANNPATLHLGGLDATLLLANKANISAKSKVLDAGCGAGHSSAFLFKHFGCEIVGIDHCGESIKNAKSIYQKSLGKSVNFSVSEITKLDFVDNYFDVIMCESVLFSIKNKEKVIKELYRVLKPNGYICFNEVYVFGDDEKAIKKFFKEQFSFYLENNKFYEKLFNKNKLETVFYTEELLTYKGWLYAIMPHLFESSSILSLLELGHIIFTNPTEQQKCIDLFKSCFYAKKYLFNNLSFVLTVVKK